MDSGNLKVSTPGDCEIVVTRSFKAPIQLVFDAWTKPELLRRWLMGPPGWTLKSCEVDLRPGGKYRLIWLGEDGTEMGMEGLYREVIVPLLLESVETFDDPSLEGESVDRKEFSEQTGVTTVRMINIYKSREVRDAMLQGGMDEVTEMGMNRLAEFIAEMQKQ